ncbi:sensor histidine kinase [Neobacillus rhizophilus]|uniref:histidine kinase n=1 Tax=Neobacillus rhizophilus TaxID=2833579 RepID=A0A942U846_9BACI|nr:ATP-binding protein [Neobacillus rhizophilus]MBS4213199.1 sensor histidine kinase [Neobacillus rhizophilus]MBU8914678.1 sensor histidine kinase [Bacillus sp. FJAT-29953]
MSYRFLPFLTALIPTILIGGFEFFRHSELLHQISMETGNYLITILTFLISYAFALWVFHLMKKQNRRITVEREMRVIYEERERLAKELHDSIAQTLFLLKVHLKKGKHDEAGALVNSIDTQLRQAIFNLRMSPAKDVSFSKRIENWLEDWSVVSGIDVDLSLRLIDAYFTPAEEVQLFGIIQEAFTNIRKHSEASNVTFHFHVQEDEWTLKIEDNGVGFKVSNIGLKQYGVSMLQERSERLGAICEIDSKEGRGTKIIVRGMK